MVDLRKDCRAELLGGLDSGGPCVDDGVGGKRTHLLMGLAVAVHVEMPGYDDRGTACGEVFVDRRQLGPWGAVGFRGQTLGRGRPHESVAQQ